MNKCFVPRRLCSIRFYEVEMCMFQERTWSEEKHNLRWKATRRILFQEFLSELINLLADISMEMEGKKKTF